MLPLTLTAAQTVANLLTTNNAIGAALTALTAGSEGSAPAISNSSIVITPASTDLGDKNMQLTYPRICLYASTVNNKQVEKFRSLSGTLNIIAEVWASGNMVTMVDQWIHYYVEALTEVLRQNIGDWGNGLFFSGKYDIQFQAPKVGGFGYVESAKVTCTLDVSVN